MKLFDIHCDTAHKMYIDNYRLDSSPLSVSLEKLERFDTRAQVMAVWSDCRLSDEAAFSAFHKIVDYLNFEVERLDDRAAYAIYSGGLNKEDKRTKIVLSLEDARLLCGRISRLHIIHARGVRLLIPVWGGQSIIGGAYDTNEGLTDFGKEVIRKCFEIGITPDVSHSSVKTADEIFEMAAEAGKTVIASHSNSFSVCPHPRNLNDKQFEAVKKSGGVVGISLHAPHLNNTEKANTDDVIKHVEHYMSLGGESTLALGCDFDGTDFLPDGLEDASRLTELAEALARLNYTETAINGIFYENAARIIEKII